MHRIQSMDGFNDRIEIQMEWNRRADNNNKKNIERMH